MEFDILFETIMTDQWPEIDAQYLKAIEANDLATARKLVNDAAGVVITSSGIDRDGAHSPSDPDNGAPAYDLTLGGTYPKDVYSFEGSRYYSTGEDAMDRTAYSILMSLKDHPNNPVKIYRATEKTATGGIKPGEWVTIVRAYAVDHGRNTLKNDYRIFSKTVAARDIYTSGDSWLEWGYHPQKFFPPIIRRDFTTKEIMPLSKRYGHFNNPVNESIGDIGVIEKIQMDIARDCPCSRSYDHGIKHWQRVERNGLKIAEKNGADEDVIRLFAYLHDCKRENEYTDPLHGPRAAAYAR
ncbi:MAG: hypothetical protein WCP55_02025, partial [Lentisphaerota bacterium]